MFFFNRLSYTQSLHLSNQVHPQNSKTSISPFKKNPKKWSCPSTAMAKKEMNLFPSQKKKKSVEAPMQWVETTLSKIDILKGSSVQLSST